MSHLNLETLARLVEELPTDAEAQHLELCATCRDELEEMRAEVASLGELPDIAPSPRAWSRLEARLESEGLVRAKPKRAALASPWLRMAASFALFGLGIAAGAALMAPRGGSSVAIAPAGTEPSAVVPTTHLAADVAPPAQQPELAPEHEAESSPDVVRERGPRRETTRSRSPVQFASWNERSPSNAEEALAFLRDAEATYLDALTRYAELAGGVDGGDPLARLAALEGIVMTTRAALGQAPADPVINGYHMTALAQRDATLRQLAAASPNLLF